VEEVWSSIPVSTASLQLGMLGKSRPRACGAGGGDAHPGSSEPEVSQDDPSLRAQVIPSAVSHPRVRLQLRVENH
jgi:hypothetical protein